MTREVCLAVSSLRKSITQLLQFIFLASRPIQILIYFAALYNLDHEHISVAKFFYNMEKTVKSSISVDQLQQEIPLFQRLSRPLATDFTVWTLSNLKILSWLLMREPLPPTATLSCVINYFNIIETEEKKTKRARNSFKANLHVAIWKCFYIILELMMSFAHTVESFCFAA